MNIDETVRADEKKCRRARGRINVLQRLHSAIRRYRRRRYSEYPTIIAIFFIAYIYIYARLNAHYGSTGS